MDYFEAAANYTYIFQSAGGEIDHCKVLWVYPYEKGTIWMHHFINENQISAPFLYFLYENTQTIKFLDKKWSVN